ncbi:hypothetical protein EON82_08710 [bacterium]|nr:MAG: hypothetical protein EON82_08710 [bacterium]
MRPFGPAIVIRPASARRPSWESPPTKPPPMPPGAPPGAPAEYPPIAPPLPAPKPPAPAMPRPRVLL